VRSAVGKELEDGWFSAGESLLRNDVRDDGAQLFV
jgi:hypothetical protein